MYWQDISEFLYRSVAVTSMPIKYHIATCYEGILLMLIILQAEISLEMALHLNVLGSSISWSGLHGSRW